MKNEYMSHAVCPICSKQDGRVLQRSGSFLVLGCRQCGHAFVDPVPTAEQLAAHYDGNYYEPWMAGQAGARKRMWQRRLKRVCSHTPGGTLLDVGCGDGEFLEAAKAGGWKVSGTEVSEWACRHVESTLGAEVFQGELASIHFGKRKWDVITLWHVLEHMVDPVGALKVVREHLAENGLVVVEVPNQENRVFQMAYRLARGRRLPLFEESAREWHLQHFSDKSLALALEQAGLVASKITSDPDSQVEPAKRIIDGVARFIDRLLRENCSETLMVFAR